MEFWGAEVKSGEPLKVQPGREMLVHLSQASIGEVKKSKGSETVHLYVTLKGKKMVLGTLFSDRLPQQQLDLVFDHDFELSHNWKSGSVYFHGYKADNPKTKPDDETDETDDEFDNLPLAPGFEDYEDPDAKVKKEKKPADVGKSDVATTSKSKVKIVEPIKDESDDEDSEDDSDEEDSSDEDSKEDEDESDSDEDDDDSDEDEETPKKVESGKKKAAEKSSKSPVPSKKAKMVTPQKADGKKGAVHVATPHPSKQGGKSVASTSNQPATPKSVGSHTCDTCKKKFNSESAVQSHSKAKHSAGK